MVRAKAAIDSESSEVAVPPELDELDDSASELSAESELSTAFFPFAVVFLTTLAFLATGSTHMAFA
jgi:hypothetical protein